MGQNVGQRHSSRSELGRCLHLTPSMFLSARISLNNERCISNRILVSMLLGAEPAIAPEVNYIQCGGALRHVAPCGLGCLSLATRPDPAHSILSSNLR